MAILFKRFSTVTIVCDVCTKGHITLDTSHIALDNYNNDAVDAILDEAFMRGWTIGSRHECNCTRPTSQKYKEY